MAPRTRRTISQSDEVLNPIDETMFVDAQGIAGDFAEVLDALAGFDAGAIKGFLYKKSASGMGKYEIVEESSPPFDMSDIVSDLKERFGGGDFQLRLLAGGRIRKNIDFSIVREKSPVVPVKDTGDSMFMMLQLMMTQQAESTRQMMQQQSEAARAREASSAQQVAMIVGLATAIGPVIFGGREKTSELMLAIAAMQPKSEGAGSTLALLKDAKELFGGNGGNDKGDDTADMVQNAVRLIGPAMRAGADMIAGRRREGPFPDGGQMGEPDDAPPPLMIPAPNGEAAKVTPPAASRYRVIDVIRDDVLFFYGRNHDPEKAADLVYDVLDVHHVTDQEIDDLVAAFAISADPLDDLAREGIDLRQRPEWANAFLAALIAIHADPGGEDERTVGGGGGHEDAPGNGAAFPEGQG